VGRREGAARREVFEEWRVDAFGEDGVVWEKFEGLELYVIRSRSVMVESVGILLSLTSGFGVFSVWIKIVLLPPTADERSNVFVGCENGCTVGRVLDVIAGSREVAWCRQR
jgi:hypothetical protein